MIVPYEQLKEHLGGSSIEEVIVRLRERNIHYLVGKRGRPFTTEFAINAAMGLVSTDKTPAYQALDEVEIV